MPKVFKVKDLSPKKKCDKGHEYPEKYKKDCKFCVERFGVLNES